MVARRQSSYVKASEFARGLLRRLVDLCVDAVRDRRTSKRWNEETFNRYDSKIFAITDRIRKRYPTQPILSDISIDGRLDFDDHPILSSRDLVEAWEVNDRLNAFYHLAREGAFADFRRCALPTCARYFYPLRPERLYCSPECQRKHYKQDPDRQREAARYQKDYYHDYQSAEAMRIKARFGIKALHERREQRLRSAKLKTSKSHPSNKNERFADARRISTDAAAPRAKRASKTAKRDLTFSDLAELFLDASKRKREARSASKKTAARIPGKGRR